MLLKQNSCHLDGSSCLLFLFIFLVYLTRGGSISGGMGSFIYLLWADSVAELEQQADFILRHADGSGWLSTKGSE